MSETVSLVMGANGFLGSHVARQLVAANQPTKVFIRSTADTRSVDDLALPEFYGDVMDRDSLRAALQECDIIYYCIVDTRAWLKDTSPLFETNIDGLKNVLAVAVEVGVKKFIFTSSIVTIGIQDQGLVNEENLFNWYDKAPAYVRCRAQAEKMVLDCAEQKGLDAVAMCIANTYGPGDIQPTPHGELIKNVVFEKTSLPIDAANPVVDIRDAATAMILASSKGRKGERYIVVAEHINQIELFAHAADMAGVPKPKLKLSIPVVYTIAFIAEMALKLVGKRTSLNRESILLTSIFNEMDSSKAKKELGWHPRSIKESIADAVKFYLANP